MTFPSLLLRLLALVITPTALALVVLVEWFANGGSAMSDGAGMAFGLVTLFLIPPFAVTTLTIPLWLWLLRAAPLRRLLVFSGVVLLGYVASSALLGWVIFSGLWPRDGGVADSLTFYVLPFAPIVLAMAMGYFVARRPALVPEARD